MVVMILENVSPSLRGELTRWLIEPHPGVFVGHVTARVRDLLWKLCCDACVDGGQQRKANKQSAAEGKEEAAEPAAPVTAEPETPVTAEPAAPVAEPAAEPVAEAAPKAE